MAFMAVVNAAEAEYIFPYKIHLWFSDGAEKIVDFQPFLEKSRHPEIWKYLDIDLFKQFSIAHGRFGLERFRFVFSHRRLVRRKNSQIGSG